MKIEVKGHDALYDVQSVCQLFFPGVSFAEENGCFLLSVLEEDRAYARLTFEGDTFFSEVARDAAYDHVRVALKKSVYEVLQKATGLFSPWGIFTGIKPAVYYDTLTKRYPEEADRIFRDLYLVDEEKLALAKRVCEVRRPAVDALTEKDVSLYISIPFCPSRCRYCSFVSSSTEKEARFLEPYVKMLCEELVLKGRFIKESGYRVTTVYVGGGTPGVLSPEQIDLLLSTVFSSVDTAHLCEFTFEAGRPDTITEEKLSVLKKYGVRRISINPQTLKDEVLQGIGRRHSVKQFFDAYALAERQGFDINVDIIAGLPGDTMESFTETCLQLAKLHPANLTMHSLYLKRAADLSAEPLSSVREQGNLCAEMVRFAEQFWENEGYRPYYLYRQKSTVGNQENVGYALPGKECLYNIYMMDDLQTVIGAGANAMSKFMDENGTAKRICNTKFAYNYIDDFSHDMEKFDQVAKQVWNT